MSNSPTITVGHVITSHVNALASTLSLDSMSLSCRWSICKSGITGRRTVSLLRWCSREVRLHLYVI